MVWKPVVGYEGYYEVSDTGLVRGVDRIVPDMAWGVREVPGQYLKAAETKSTSRGGQGYLAVNLHKNGIGKVILVHRIVANAFLENPNNFPTVNHKDGNKQNNNLSNLEWVSYADNNIHALATHLRSPRGIRVFQLSKDGKVLGQYKSVCEASRQTGIGRSMISHCVNGRAKLAGGFKWVKAEKCNDYLYSESTAEDELPLEVQERDVPEDIVCTGGNVR